MEFGTYQRLNQAQLLSETFSGQRAALFWTRIEEVAYKGASSAGIRRRSEW